MSTHRTGLDHTEHHARISQLAQLQVPDPEFGDVKLNVFPFQHDGVTPIQLPEGFRKWEQTVRDMMAHVPVQHDATQCFVTIDSKFFTQDDYLRREGIHMDGNFCGDLEFSWGLVGVPRNIEDSPEPLATWGGGCRAWASGIVALSDTVKPDNSHVHMGFQMPYDIVVPLGKYVSGSLGGTIVASSSTGCLAYPGSYQGRVGSGGDWSDMLDQVGDPQIIHSHVAWFMSSNCPHETTIVRAGTRRTFVRITLPWNYRNEQVAP